MKIKHCSRKRIRLLCAIPHIKVIVFDDDVRQNIAGLKADTLYYADEHCVGRRDGVTSHPVGDIFFLTRDEKLVLIDTTAQAYNKMATKRKHMQNFAKLWDCENDYLPCEDC